MFYTDFLNIIKSLLIIYSINCNISPSHGESCNFDGNSLSRGSGSGLSSSGNRYSLPFKQKTECPCFHTDTEKRNDENCPPLDKTPLTPLIDCAYLPREFIECAEPVDHAGNLTAKDKLGHGCLKVGYKSEYGVNPSMGL